MRVFVTLFLAIAFYCKSTAFGKDHLLFMGGGGESLTKNDTIFDQGLKNFSKYIKTSPQTDISIAFNGGHSETEKILKDSFSSTIPKRGFSSQDYNDIIEEYKNKLLNNEFQSGDQFMILNDTHGFTKNASATSSTHLVSSSDGDVDLDKLKELKQLAKEKGVRMAIVDLSCYSGNSLSLADDNTCVVTAASAGQKATSGFSESFISNMKKGRNLEDVFLLARQQDSSARLTSPSISTDVGLSINTSLNDEILNAMENNSSYDSYNKKLTFNEYFFEPSFIEKDEKRRCDNELFFKSALDYVGILENLYSQTKQSFLFWKRRDKKFDKFKQALAEYRDYLDFSAQIKKVFIEKEKEFGPLHVKNEFSPTDWGTLLIDVDKTLKDLKKEYSSGKSSKKAKNLLRTISYYEDLKIVKKKTLKQHPDLNLIVKKYEALDFDRLSTNVIYEERRLYQKIYKQLQSDQAARPNPCTDFKL